MRRRARRSELGEPRWQLGQRLAATRLLVADRDPTGVESVELVHEALIGGWSRLSEWCDADRAFRIWQERLRGAVAQWETVLRNEGALLRGAPLAEAERWLAERPDDLGAPERQFIQASRALRDRSVRRWRVVAAVLALLLLVSSSLSGVALWQFNQADNQSRLAQSRALVAQANPLIYSQPDVAMLLAAAAYRKADTQEAIDALTSMASRQQHVDRLIVTGVGNYPRIMFSPTDPTMVALTYVNGIELWDVKTGVRLRSRPDADTVDLPFSSPMTFSPSGRILAYLQNAEQGLKVVLWSHMEDRVVREIPLTLAPGDYINNLIFSPDGNLLGGCVGRQIRLWSLDLEGLGGASYSIQLVNGNRCAFGFRNEGRDLAYIDGDEIITRDIATGRVASSRPRPPKIPPRDPLFSQFEGFSADKLSDFVVAPDGRSAIYGNGAGENAWWDFDRQDSRAIDINIRDAIFTPDGRRVAIFLNDGVILLDVTGRIPIASYRKSYTGSSAFSPDGRTIAGVDENGVISLINTDLYYGIPATVSRVAMRPGDDHVTTVSNTGEVAIYPIGDLNPEPFIVRSHAHYGSGEGRVESLSSNGLYYAFTDDRARKIRLLDVSPSAGPEMPLEISCSDALQLAFDPHGEFLACAGKSDIVVWSTKNRTESSRISLPLDYKTKELAVGPGGRYFSATSSSGETQLWDTRSGDRNGIDLQSGDVKSMSFSPDGELLGVGGQNEVKLWNLNAKKFDPRRIP